MIRALIVDRTPHQRMNGVARYMLGLTSHPDPKALNVDLRILNWGRELSVKQWHKQFNPSASPLWSATYVNRRFLRPLAQRCSRADVIHYPFHYLPHDWTAGTGAKIVTVHGASAYAEDLWEPERANRIKCTLHSGLDDLAQVITVSEWSKQELVEHFALPVDKIAVIPNGVRLEQFRPIAAKDTLNAWLSVTFSIRTPYLLHVGPCEQRKNLLRLVQAFAHLKQRYKLPHLLVLAGSPGRLSETLWHTIIQLGITNDVLFVGVIDDDSLVKLYNGADVFIFPSLYEGFGIPVLEAMACGTPVITSRNSALSEVAGNAAALVDDPTDVENLIDVCEQVITNVEMQKTLRQRGYERVSQYSWHACAMAHLQLYLRVAREVGRS